MYCARNIWTPFCVFDFIDGRGRQYTVRTQYNCVCILVSIVFLMYTNMLHLNHGKLNTIILCLIIFMYIQELDTNAQDGT